MLKYTQKEDYMKILKVVSSEINALKSISSSMDGEKSIAVANMLDACGCTGNGMC